MTRHQQHSAPPPRPESGSEADQQLRARLRAHDPARGLPTTTQGETTARLEDAMAETPDGYATRVSGARRRSPLTWLVAAATVVLLLGVGWAGLRLGDRGAPAASAPTPSAPASATGPGDGSGATSSPEGSVLALALPGPSPGRCMVPTAAALANQEVAFEGRVDRVEDGMVRLAVDRWYRGDEEPAVVELPEVDDALRRVVVAPDFVVGQSYLVSATDGLVTLCGFTDRARPPLRAIYERAFGR